MPVEEWICKGKRVAKGGGLAVFFLLPDDTSAGFVLPSKHTASRARPGMVFTVDDHRFLNYIRTEKSERVEEWTVESEAAEAEIAANRQIKKASDEATIKNMLEPVREVYRKCVTPAQRRAVLMSVMEAITR